MSASILQTTGVVLMVGGGKVYVDGPDPVPGEEALGVPASAEQERAYAALLMKEDGVRITIEPADAPPHGSPLDYLAELKSLLSAAQSEAHCGGTWDQVDRAISRCLSLANSAHLAILAERARR
jgi:hypothetical protein